MDIQKIQDYYAARGLKWADAKSALLFFLSEVGELADAYLSHYENTLTKDEKDLLIKFSEDGLQADDIVSKIPGWIRNNDRLHKTNIAHEVADCNMMLSVFMYSLTKSTPDQALEEKMMEKIKKLKGIDVN
jgi:NTP pyrophosphatase (non-canonical NTP hydrolase)